MKKQFYQGYAAAIASMIRCHGESGMAIDIMQMQGVTLDDLKKADADPFDMEPIGKAWKESHPREKNDE